MSYLKNERSYEAQILVKLVFRSVKMFSKKTSKNFFDLNALLNNQNSFTTNHADLFVQTDIDKQECKCDIFLKLHLRCFCCYFLKQAAGWTALFPTNQRE